jgi:hypothetical protein
MDKRKYTQRIISRGSQDYQFWMWHVEKNLGSKSTEVLNGLTLGKVILMPSPLQRWLEHDHQSGVGISFLRHN